MGTPGKPESTVPGGGGAGWRAAWEGCGAVGGARDVRGRARKRPGTRERSGWCGKDSRISGCGRGLGRGKDTGGEPGSRLRPGVTREQARRAAGLRPGPRVPTARLCLQLGMFALQLGVLATFLSEPVVKALTSGAALHVLVSQLPSLLGLPLPRQLGCFALFKVGAGRGKPRQGRARLSEPGGGGRGVPAAGLSPAPRRRWPPC